MSKNGSAAVLDEEETKAVENGVIHMTWTGLTPLVMHNRRLANPSDKFGKLYRAASSKRGKSEDDLDALARIEFEGGLYYDEKLGPVIPAENIEKTLVMGARKNRKGKGVEALVTLEAALVPVEYKGPRDVDRMWKAHMYDDRLVGNSSGSSVLRTRPMFKEWSLEFDLLVDPEVDRGDVIRAAEVAGKWVGLCEHSFRWGRFEVRAT